MTRGGSVGLEGMNVPAIVPSAEKQRELRDDAAERNIRRIFCLSWCGSQGEVRNCMNVYQICQFATVHVCVSQVDENI